MTGHTSPARTPRALGEQGVAVPAVPNAIRDATGPNPTHAPVAPEHLYGFEPG
jgi:CO/xanthine dehydrogenase Mo-binding subunit